MTCTFRTECPIAQFGSIAATREPQLQCERGAVPLGAMVAEVPMLVIELRPDVSWARPTLSGPSFIVDAGGVASQAGISHAVEFAPTVRTSAYCSKTHPEVTRQRPDQNC